MQFKGETDRVKELGSIKIEVWHVRKIGQSTMRLPSADELEGLGIVSEKAIAGQSTSHSVGYIALYLSRMHMLTQVASRNPFHNPAGQWSIGALRLSTHGWVQRPRSFSTTVPSVSDNPLGSATSAADVEQKHFSPC